MGVDYGVEVDGGPNKGEVLEHTLVGRHASAQLDDSAAYCFTVNCIKDVSWIVRAVTRRYGL